MIGIQDIFYNDTALDNVVKADIDKEFGGTWKVDVRMVDESRPTGFGLGEEIVIDDETFYLRQGGNVREGENLFYDFTAFHKAFQLEDSVVTEEYTLMGNIQEHAAALFVHQAGINYTIALEPEMSQSAKDDFLDIEAELQIEEGMLYKRFRYILREFQATWRPEGNTIYLMPEHFIRHTTLSFEYALNNKDIEREYDYERVVGTLIAQAWLRGDFVDGVVDPVVIKSYGSGTPERFKDFGTFRYESSLDKTAQQYLSTYEYPEAEYRMTVVDLLRMSEEDRPSGVSSVKIDVGQGVKVEDAELGIDKYMKIQRVQYSLVEPHKPAKVTVGEIRKDYYKDFQIDIIDAKEDRERRQPRLYTSTDPDEVPDPEMGKYGDVFIRPEAGD